MDLCRAGLTCVCRRGSPDRAEPLSCARKEPFQFIKTVVSDLDASVKFYTTTMGMEDLAPAFPGAADGGAVLGYSGDQVPLILVPGDVDWQEYSGRHAISIPEQQLLQIYERVGGDVAKDEANESSESESVVHAIRTFHEEDPVTGVGLGDLRIAIIKDPDAYEICVVSSETFDKAVANPPWIGPGELPTEDTGSWQWRREKIDATAKKSDRGRSS